MSMLINYTSQKLRNLLLILLLMGLIFSVNWYTHQPLFNSYYADSDQQEYYEAGVKMAKLEGIIIYPHRMNLNSFIYAIFFRIFGPSFKLAILLNILFLTLCIPMLWYILGQLNITIPLRVCSLLLLVNVQISRFTEILSEPLLALTLCLFFTLLIKLAKYQKYHFLAGISLGLIFATHFSTIGLITIFVLYITILCLKKQNIKYCLHFLLGISILLIPIFVIRWYMFGTPLINSENIIKLTEGVDKVHISKIKKDNISFSSFLDFSERIKRGFKYSVPAIHREIYAPFLLPSLLLSLFFLMKNYQDLRYTLSIPLIITFLYQLLLFGWHTSNFPTIRFYIPYAILFIPFSISFLDLVPIGKLFVSKIAFRIRNILLFCLVVLLLYNRVPHFGHLRNSRIWRVEFDKVFYKIHRWLDKAEGEQKGKIMLRHGPIEKRQFCISPPIDSADEIFKYIEKQKVDYFITHEWLDADHPIRRAILEGKQPVPNNWHLVLHIKKPLHLKMFAINRKINPELIKELQLNFNEKNL